MSCGCVWGRWCGIVEWTGAGCQEPWACGPGTRDFGKVIWRFLLCLTKVSPNSNPLRLWVLFLKLGLHFMLSMVMSLNVLSVVGAHVSLDTLWWVQMDFKNSCFTISPNRTMLQTFCGKYIWWKKVCNGFSRTVGSSRALTYARIELCKPESKYPQYVYPSPFG